MQHGIIHPVGAETSIFWESCVSAIAADALALWDIGSMCYKRFSINGTSTRLDFNCPVPYMCSEMLGNAKIYCNVSLNGQDMSTS